MTEAMAGDVVIVPGSSVFAEAWDAIAKARITLLLKMLLIPNELCIIMMVNVMKVVGSMREI